MVCFGSAVIHTRSLNDFLAAWSFAASASDSAVVSAAGSGEEPEVDSSTGAITCFFFFRMEGTSLSTFLLLTEDMLLSCGFGWKRNLVGVQKINFYQLIELSLLIGQIKLQPRSIIFEPQLFLSSSHPPLYRKNGASKKEEAHAPWCQQWVIQGSTCESGSKRAKKHGNSNWSWRSRTQCEPAGKGCTKHDGARYCIETEGEEDQSIEGLSYNGGAIEC